MSQDSIAPGIRVWPVPALWGYEVGEDGSFFTRWPEGRRGPNKMLPRVPVRRRLNGWIHPTTGYRMVKGAGRRYALHELVLRTFVGPRPEGLECCHEDNDRTNAALSNLRYDTPTGNQRDRVRHGTHSRGERHHMVKLTEEKVRLIRRLYAEGWSQYRIAREIGVCRGNVAMIVRRKTWRHI